jgi:hypothetical protein
VFLFFIFFYFLFFFLFLRYGLCGLEDADCLPFKSKLNANISIFVDSSLPVEKYKSYQVASSDL